MKIDPTVPVSTIVFDGAFAFALVIGAAAIQAMMTAKPTA